MRTHGEHDENDGSTLPAPSGSGLRPLVVGVVILPLHGMDRCGSATAAALIRMLLLRTSLKSPSNESAVLVFAL
jgi:hypothetical protein